MSKHQVAVLKVVSKQLSVTAAAAESGINRQHLQRLLRRYRDGGLDAIRPRSRRPHTSPGGISDEVRGRIVALRTELTARGLDAGPLTIAWHLEREGRPTPSTSTIRRILHAAGLVVPEPRKRPRSSWIRFEATAPNDPQTQGKIERFQQTLKRWLEPEKVYWRTTRRDPGRWPRSRATG